jgi:hypothetical protein
LKTDNRVIGINARSDHRKLGTFNAETVFETMTESSFDRKHEIKIERVLGSKS